MITEQELLDCAELMRINLEEWQKEIIFDTVEKRWCLNCGRKRGKTTTIEFRAVWRLMNYDVEGNGLVGGIAIVSEELRAAKNILSGIKTILTGLGWRIGKELKDRSEEKKICFATVTELVMPNNNRVLVFPAGAAGDNIRPYTFHEFIYDEADFIPDAVYVATGPCLARFDGVEILESTPNRLGSKETYFCKGFLRHRPGYRVYHLPTTEALHIPKEWLTLQKKQMSSLEYEREILAQFTSDITAVFPKDLLQECLGPIDWPVQPDGVFLGVTFARFDSENSFITENFNKDSVNYLRITMIPQRGRRIMEVEQMVADMVAANPYIQKIVVDNRSMGTAPMEGLASILGDYMVAGVSNHETIQEIEGARKRYMKEDLYVNFLKLMERGQIKFEDKRIEAALMDVKHEYSKRNKMIWIFANDMCESIVRSVFPVWGRKEWLGPVPDKFLFFPDNRQKL